MKNERVHIDDKTHSQKPIQHFSPKKIVCLYTLEQTASTMHVQLKYILLNGLVTNQRVFYEF